VDTQCASSLLAAADPHTTGSRAHGPHRSLVSSTWPGHGRGTEATVGAGGGVKSAAVAEGLALCGRARVYDDAAAAAGVVAAGAAAASPSAFLPFLPLPFFGDLAFFGLDSFFSAPSFLSPSVLGFLARGLVFLTSSGMAGAFTPARRADERAPFLGSSFGARLRLPAAFFFSSLASPLASALLSALLTASS